MDVTQYKDETRGRRYDVRVRLNPETGSPDDIGRIYVRAQDGRLVELANVVRFRKEEDRASSTVSTGNGPSPSLPTWRKNRWDRPWRNSMPSRPMCSPRFHPKYKGPANIMEESFQYLIFALMLGIIMAYMILAAQFESFIHPFTVLLSMPLSFIGAFGALLLTGKTINILQFIGLILLMGLVKKNSILAG